MSIPTWYLRLARPKKGVILFVFPIVRLARPKKVIILFVLPVLRMARLKKA